MINVVISSKRLEELEKAALKLNALEAGGVDNWEWYDESLKTFRNEEKKEDLIVDLVEAIAENLTAGNISHDYPAGVEAGAGYYITTDDLPDLIKVFIKEYISLEEID